MINYKYIADSIDFYQKFGFQRIESPWTVTEAIADVTRPPEAKHWTIQEKNKVLVASGEQSFLYLNEKGFLPKGRFQTVTPCFRDEPFDLTHSKYFIKNELIETYNVEQEHLVKIIHIAKQFFLQKISPNKHYLYVVNKEDGSYDIEINGIEVGSYGIRTRNGFSWIYATGCAEPRLTKALNYDGK